ncbi:MAG: AzlD domain-containing protein [Acidimicrobiia bacterium]|nr:AzlD domain-containing protein [Acidimicrobiia bacterium]
MSDGSITLFVLFAGTYLLKAAGPVLLGGRTLAPSIARLADLVPAGLLAALVAVSTFGAGESLTVDARAAGVVAAGVALWRRAPFVVVVLLAIAVTAGVRVFA